MSHMRSITPEMIRYLETKGTIDWNKVYNQIATHHADEETGPFSTKLNTIGGFISKYKDQ